MEQWGAICSLLRKYKALTSKSEFFEDQVQITLHATVPKLANASGMEEAIE